MGIHSLRESIQQPWNDDSRRDSDPRYEKRESFDPEQSCAQIMVNGGNGTGFLVRKYDRGGFVVTAAHVVETGRGSEYGAVQSRSTNIEVQFSGSRTCYRVRSVLSSRTDDIAILYIDGPIDQEPLKLHGGLRRGERVSALGFAQGGGGRETHKTNGTVTELPSEATGGRYYTDVETGIGGSGGPLLDVDGNAVGVVTQMDSAEGARVVPSEQVLELIQSAERKMFGH